MRIMTFNIKFESKEDQKNPWGYRRDLVRRIIKGHAPSILGTQEGIWEQLLFLKDNLTGYKMHVPGRIIDNTSQYPTLFYQEEWFEVLTGGELWLSTTPTYHLSKDWDSAFPRMMSYGLFLDRMARRHFWAIVTHLDHQGIEARWHQAVMISEFIQNLNGPVILMGDFNDSPDSRIHEQLTGKKTELEDTWELLGLKENEQSFTHHGFTGVPQKTRMDWILISHHFQVRDAEIVRDNFQGRYPSDHFPYTVDLAWL